MTPVERPAGIEKAVLFEGEATVFEQQFAERQTATTEEVEGAWSTFGYTGRPSNGRRDLASVWDVSADYQLTRSLSATLYYAHAAGRHVIDSIYTTDGAGRLAYVETMLRF